MCHSEKKTLRLLFPQWQGGNNGPYYFGSQLLNWLAPEPDGPIEQVVVSEPDGQTLPVENGIVARTALLRQADNARHLIDRHKPDRIVILGGDCLVDLVPFAYLNEVYGGDLAVLWVDAHPDVMSPDVFEHAHAMVLGNLLGEGDSDFVAKVKIPIKPQNVMYAGLQKISNFETAFIERLNLRHADSDQLALTSEPVLKWLNDIGAKYVAVHLDLDVLDVTKFHSLYFGRPDAEEGAFDGISQGKMTMQQVIRLLNDVSRHTDIVALGIAEHLPWDAIQLKNMLKQLPLFSKFE